MNVVVSGTREAAAGTAATGPECQCDAVGAYRAAIDTW